MAASSFSFKAASVYFSSSNYHYLLVTCIGFGATTREVGGFDRATEGAEALGFITLIIPFILLL